jgi:cell wall-associated NlpC family hydrolase
MTMTITRDAIVMAARSYLSTRYHHQGRNRAGMDCAGLIVCVARDLGVDVGDVAGYARVPDGESLRQAVESQAQRVAVYKPGDILLMRFDGDPQHLAIVTDRGMIHSYAQARKVVEHSIDVTWARRVVAAYQFPGVEK